jgi:hypothetical protein
VTDMTEIERLREIVAGAHAIRCVCDPWKQDPRCRELQSMAMPEKEQP